MKTFFKKLGLVIYFLFVTSFISGLRHQELINVILFGACMGSSLILVFWANKNLRIVWEEGNLALSEWVSLLCMGQLLVCLITRALW